MIFRKHLALFDDLTYAVIPDNERSECDPGSIGRASARPKHRASIARRPACDGFRLEFIPDDDPRPE